MAPPGCDGLYVLVPVPHATEGVDWAVEAPRLRERVLARLEQEGYGDLRGHIRVERQLTPHGWGQAFNLEKGAAFGLAHDFFQVACFRPRNQDATFPNVFFVGASTQPGTGLPMVLLSAQLLETRVATYRARAPARPARPALAPPAERVA
jgi:phytoene desaturase